MRTMESNALISMHFGGSARHADLIYIVIFFKKEMDRYGKAAKICQSCSTCMNFCVWRASWRRLILKRHERSGWLESNWCDDGEKSRATTSTQSKKNRRVCRWFFWLCCNFFVSEGVGGGRGGEKGKQCLLGGI
jgi:L-lactate utilization protein LutB